MNVYAIDPLADARWEPFVASHEHGSVFHTPQWLEALRRSYGFRSVVYTTAAPGAELKDGMVLCRVESWLTGRRLVGVPFADHCEPLLGEDVASAVLFRHLEQVRRAERYRFVELRPLGMGSVPGFGISQTFVMHVLDLAPSVAQVFSGLHRDSVQRRIRRAERDRVEHHQGNSDFLLQTFYRLLTHTRRRHGLPPQPLHWFENLRACLGARMIIHVASKDGIPIASIVTLQHRRTLYYKYGASDARYHGTGAMPFLLWKAVLVGKDSGLVKLDLGRSDEGNAGLITFKNRFGSHASPVVYLRLPPPASRVSSAGVWRAAARLTPYVPNKVLVGAGRLLYRHFA